MKEWTYEERVKAMPKEQKTFTREFKQEAVQLVRSSSKSQAQIARDLGIADSTLHHWCKVFAEDGELAFPGSGHQKPQQESHHTPTKRLLSWGARRMGSQPFCDVHSSWPGRRMRAPGP